MSSGEICMRYVLNKTTTSEQKSGLNLVDLRIIGIEVVDTLWQIDVSRGLLTIGVVFSKNLELSALGRKEFERKG
jgi:hypothetical protein